MVKVLFFGTPAVAVPFLDWLLKNTTVVGVVCRPDEPAGRGYEITSPPTKTLAQEKNIPVFQPVGPWTDSVIETFSSLKADIGIVVAYGRILPRSVFMAPRLGSINIHFSLLPQYRGAAPIQWALINGETTTGVSSFWLEEGLDSGPIFFQDSLPVDSLDTTLTLREKLISLGLQQLEKLMEELSHDRIRKTPQTGDPTFAPQLKKEDGRIDWGKSARQVNNLIRGVIEWPGAFTSYRSTGAENKTLKIFKATVQDILTDTNVSKWSSPRNVSARGPGLNQDPDQKACRDDVRETSSASSNAPGTILGTDEKGILVQTGQGVLSIQEVQPEGKKKMPALSFWQGARMKKGDQFGIIRKTS